MMIPSEQAGLRIIGSWLRQRARTRLRIGVAYQVSG
jgi:hypothetical protein